MNTEIYVQIEAYLLGRLSTDKAAAIERRINSDSAFALEVEKYKMEREAIQILREEELRMKFKQWDNAHEKQKIVQENTITRSNRFNILAIAASFFFILGLATWLYTNNSTATTALAYYDLPMHYNAQFKGNTTALNPLKEGMTHLQADEYEEAIQFFSTPFENADTQLQAQLLLGHAYLDSGLHTNNKRNLTRASIIFNALKKYINRNIQQEASWYWILSVLDTQADTPEFKNSLNEITNNQDHKYYAKAKALAATL